MDGVTLIDRPRHSFGMYHDSTRRDAPVHHASYSSTSYPTRYPSSHSPPYNSGESNKPSLPSLRSVLGESGMSPPATPPSQGHSLQPLPREPIYDHQPTYKPASLYPNKRTRTDSGWDARTPERTFTETAPKNLPYMPTRHEDTRPRSQYDLPTPSSRSPVIHSHHASPDLRVQRTDLPRTYPSPALPRSDVYPTSDPMLTARNRSSMYSNASSVSQDDDMRRHSGYGEYQPQPSRERYAVEPPRQSYMSVPANNMPREEYPPVARLDVPQAYGNAPYPYSHAFFVPSHYEYQNGKSRKRSNLPKQSTEIMKRWFDENMHNPYPSEEQKRHFAAVAGINLTQVSNWFINHRRRCPELREKRDKSRAGSREDDMQ
ncbi:MAG: Uncharacterized protein AUREO_033310 [Aureobasidium pullulans]|uniref:Homeobox domain-containing protein n=3 Tax=Aureobasidium TaxID=5579 RepID=A0A1A7MJS6_AURPU|nr:MAG: Uncharacterized protein AUREO_033310 [Aureobasidium pullulans]THV89702.1 hypothetical protein D6D27_06298 [Aureobasidium pullulans]THV92597.1 hypothetical protein D6D26_08485 [Aureobasidium pullulans]THW30516.1 hypothetical protein D6D23_00118 [Aureobasidium pullulans]THW44784.1 hypothetical protein D6D22_03856 [Aureobasidium pullulans]